MLLWRYGVRHLLREAWRTGAVRAGVPQFVPRRWRFPWTIDPDPPAWIAPDPTLRAQAARRLEESYPIHGAGSSGDSYYLREIRARLDSPDRSLLQEEAFLQGRRLGVPVRQPFADAELIEFLVRVHPRVRSAGGQAKALLRGPLVRRFPQLGFDRQRKSWLGGPFLAVVASQAGEAWRELGGVRTLAALGVVDPERARALLDDTIAGRGSRAAPGWVWDVLNLEAWARAHC